MDYIETINKLTIENASLKAELSELRAKLDHLMEQLSSSRRKLFGVSSEKTIYNNNEQLTYVEGEPEIIVIHEVAEPDPPRSVTRPKKRAEMSTRLPANMPVEIVECTLPGDELEKHGGRMHAIGRTLARRELVITPAKATITEFWQTSYSCRESEANDEKPYIIKAPLPPQMIKGSMCSPETAAHIICQKYVMGVPIYRQCKDWNRRGIPISKQTAVNWAIAVSKTYFKPIYDELRRMLLKHTLLHSDGTTFQVLRERGKEAQSKSQMWMYRTGSDAEYPIALFDYQPDKKKERPRDFLEGFSGYLTTDAYAAYQSLPDNIVVTGCFYHARSYFKDAMKCLKPKDRTGSLALVGQGYCNKLFDIEREAEGKTFTERYKIRSEKAAPALEEFHAWLKSVEPHVSTTSKLGKAVGYALNQWEYLIRYLLDGRIECSNNRSERTIKSFVINRKNFLFATSEAGGHTAAVLQSITETAKESLLDPFKYLAYVLHTAAGKNIRDDAALLTSLLPQNAPKDCAAF